MDNLSQTTDLEHQIKHKTNRLAYKLTKGRKNRFLAKSCANEKKAVSLSQLKKPRNYQYIFI